MTELEVTVGGEVVAPTDGVSVTWVDRAAGVVRITDGARSRLALVEGGGPDWTVTLDGRRVPARVSTWRERTLAAADVAAAGHGGPVAVTASLPGLVVAVEVEAGAHVVAGDPLLTIEAMKMQNEVRAPRDGTVGQVLVAAGVAVATGQLLLRLD